MEFADSIIPLVTLIVLEIILGIDNIIFIAILADKLPPEQRDKLRYWGLGLAMFIRLALLAVIAWIMQLDKTLFSVFGIDFSGKGLILLAGGLFLIYKSTKEIYHKAEAGGDANAPDTTKSSFRQLLVQVLILDMVFSVDSIITAVGMVDQLWIMYTAVIVTVGIMLIASKPIADFIGRHPSFKILALCFLLIIGMSLVAEGLHFEIPKGYIYFSMAFAFLVDIIQMRTVPPAPPVPPVK
ncbi:TerC family protein [Fibrisoma montanum]|uniref:TerC family protein n=1 Tax=Fibrisoma montanum TaxID=2305895 RepID=A0A418M5Z3_9BACT|nr:TerC family protein [Fibrisoma montanum]RIV21274.1 TerC family protein [Fibrisoma montanum]